MIEEGNSYTLIKVRIKTLEGIIGYWIETEYICGQLATLENYTDEVVMIYETEDWIKNKCISNSLSLMDMKGNLQEIGKYGDKLRIFAKNELQAVLETAIQNGEGEFKNYRDCNCHEYMDKLIWGLYDSFEDIYDDNKTTQIQNFYKVLWKCLDNIKNE